MPGDMLFHQTANYHFDVHFVGGNLMIPGATIPTSPQGGIRFYSVEIDVLPGLMYHEAGNSGNVLLRPQVFATVVGAPIYIVSGVAENVSGDDAFDIHTPGGTIQAKYNGGTTGDYSDNLLNNSLRFTAEARRLLAPGFHGPRDVDAIGLFDDNVRLRRSDITFTFPDYRIGMDSPLGRRTTHTSVSTGPWRRTISCTPFRDKTRTGCIPTSGFHQPTS